MDKETVEKVARGAHLELTEEELETFSKDLDEILEFFSLLDEAPGSETGGIDPIGVADITREDVPSKDIDPEILLEGMNTYENYVRGPRLL